MGFDLTTKDSVLPLNCVDLQVNLNIDMNAKKSNFDDDGSGLK